MKIPAHKDSELASLMKLSQQGDRKSYEQLLEEIYPVLASYARQRVSDPTRAEELVQEILLGVHKARKTFHSSKRFAPWLFAIAKYKFVDHVRKMESLKKREVSGIEWIDSIGVSDTSSMKIDREVELMLSQLNETQRRIIELIKFKGHSIREVATSLNMSESAVKSTVHRAYAKLRKKYARTGSEN